jgi:vacuolar-type H+-ATPase subunit H
MVRRSYVLKDDQEALISAAKQYSAELERLFEEDARKEAADPLADLEERRHTSSDA